MTERKLMPHIRFKGFEDVWKKDQINNVTSTKSGGTPSVSNKEFYIGEIPFIRSSDINKTNTELKINNEAINSSATFIVKKGNILYALYGATSGQVAISKITGAINQAVLAIFPKPFIDKYFLMYWLAKNKQKIIAKYLQGGQGNLSAKLIKKLILIFPSGPEQQKIGALFAKLDRLLDLQQQKLDQLELLKKALLQKLFPKQGEKIPELRFKGFAEEWKKDTIGEIARTKSGGTPSVNNRKYYDGNIPFIRSSDINKTNVDLKINDEAVSYSSAFVVEKGNILYALYGATSGQVAISRITGAVNQAILAIFPKQYINKMFLMYWLSYNKEKITTKYLQGGQGNLSAKLIKKLLITFPLKDEQQKIGNLLAKVDHLIELENKKLHNLKQVKKSLLQNMFVE